VGEDPGGYVADEDRGQAEQYALDALEPAPQNQSRHQERGDGHRDLAGYSEQLESCCDPGELRGGGADVRE
jgi:hypothetical protein